MKIYTMEGAARALGVDGETLREWMAESRLQPTIDADNRPVLGEEQIQQLVRQHNAGGSYNPPAEEKTKTMAAQAGVGDVRPIALGAPQVSIGRAPDNLAVLNHPQVSGHHARLERLSNGTYRIVDLRSTNHVYVNGQRVKAQVLKPSDEVGIGPFQFSYTGQELRQQNESESIRVDALHLTEYRSWHALALHDISLPIPARTFVALVGGSGVGKTTLLNALSGLHPASKGTVLYNGQDYYRHLDDFSTQIGYVPQDDIMHNRLRVADALYYTARLRLPNDFTHAQIKERVNEVLADVGLVSRRRHLVSSLSGGEHKRVSIALELLANPSVFFLDEPSAGLDPGLDLKMMHLLHGLADKGHTIVLVTHATENIDVCDTICFLAQGGRLAFYGSPQEAKTYFGTPKFSEMYTVLEPTPEEKNVPKHAEERFKQSPYYQQHVVQTKQQLLEAAIAPNSGIDAQTLIFLMAFAAVLFGCINGAREIVKEAPIYRRERMVNLGIAPYLLSKIVVLGVFSLLQSVILVFLVNLKAPFQQGIFLPVIAEITITMMLASLVGLMIGLAISALAPNTDRALSLVPIVLIPQVIFSGSVFTLNTPILQAIGDVFAVRWAMAGMGSSVGLHGDKLGVDNFAYQGTLFVTLNPADALPGAIRHLVIVWGALALMIILLGLLTAFFLKRKDVR